MLETPFAMGSRVRRGSLLLLALMLLHTVAQAKKEQIFIAGFLPYNRSSSDAYGSIMAAADIAVNHINESPDILANYELKILWNDSQVRTLV